MIFLSQEKIICAVLDEQLHPGFDRYAPYAAIVKSDSYPSYVFPVGSPQDSAFVLQSSGSGQTYQLTVVDNYDVYQPLAVPISQATTTLPQREGNRFVVRIISTNFLKPIASAMARTRRKPSP